MTTIYDDIDENAAVDTWVTRYAHRFYRLNCFRNCLRCSWTY